MDQYQRGRSPSAGANHTSAAHSRSPSAQNGFNQQANARGLDPLLQQQPAHLGDASQQQQPYSGSSFMPPPDLPPHRQQQQQQQQQFVDSQAQLAGFDAQSNTFNHAFDPSLLDLENPNNNNFDFDPTAPLGGANGTSADLSAMNAAMQPTSMPADMSFTNPAFDNAPSHSPNDPTSRNQSLSPSSAAQPFGQSGREWAGMNFRGHRRNQSDAYSDISSSAAHHSPFVDVSESFEGPNGNSPLVKGQHDQGLADNLGMGTFTLSENMGQHISPGNSSHASPRISPQNEGFGGLGLYPPTSQLSEQFPGFDPAAGELDPTQHLEAPEISIQFAPERQPSFNDPSQGGHDHDALSPPTRGQSRPRGRAISDPYTNGSRSSTPNRNRTPSLSLHPHSRSISRSSSPGGPVNGVQKPRDRASSTSALPAQREKLIGLADPERFANVELGSGPSLNGSESGPKRTQKHPATFQCTLCPKRFTRAYNLRSHLRTHTDERPFVCTVCGKAFARQHDRKRHEGLHSGEKKFVCKGLLAGGSGNAGTWGCGRRFARADALGRHFRSEAGRACIKPLLDEEARERRAAMMEQQSQEMMNNAGNLQPGLTPAAANQGMMPGMPMGDQVDVSNIALPAALLAQYPALAGIQWDALPATGGAGGPQDEDDFGFDHSGRSSFDASSGGELDFDDEGFSGNEGGWNGDNPGMMNMPQQQQHQQQDLQGWNGAYGGS